MKKWIPNVFYVFEYDRLSYYLEKQAQQGWILEKVGLNLLRFYKSSPQDLRYCVDIPSVRQKRDGRIDYLESYYQMCEEAGWHLVGTNTVHHIFVTKDPSVPPIHTDPEIRYQAVISDIGPRMAIAVIAMVLLGVWRLQKFSGIVYLPTIPKIAFPCIFGIVFLIQMEMMWQYFRWKRSQEAARTTGDWTPVLSQWPFYVRQAENVISCVLLMVMLVPLVAGMDVDWSQQNIGSILWEIVGNPIFMVLVYALCGWLATRVLWKKGYDEKSARAIGVLIGFVVLILMMGLVFEIEDHISRKESGIAALENMEEIQEIPLTEDMLGLKASHDVICRRDENETRAGMEYTAMLDTGGYLKYDYYRYREEEAAIASWESQNKVYNRYVKEYTGEETTYHYEWLKQDISALAADQAAVLMDITRDSDFILYHYFIQKENVYWMIHYLSEEPLTEKQLQVIGAQLP